MHEAILSTMTRYIADRRDCSILSPAAVASATFQVFIAESIEPHIEYASLEHFKHMARKILGSRFNHDSDENPAYAEQGELFSGELQERYPAARKKGEEPTYKRLADLSEDDFAWNLQALRRSAKARAIHADTLQAYWQQARPQQTAA